MKFINKTQVTIVFKQGIVTRKTEARRDSIKIIGENENFICLDDDFFTAVAKGKAYSVTHSRIEKPSIHFYVNDSCFGTRIRYTLYTEKKTRKQTIKNQIKAAIDEKFGCLFNADLSIIDKL